MNTFRIARDAYRILRYDRSMRRTRADHPVDHAGHSVPQPPHPSTAGEWIVATVGAGMLAGCGRKFRKPLRPVTVNSRPIKTRAAVGRRPAQLLSVVMPH